MATITSAAAPTSWSENSVADLAKPVKLSVHYLTQTVLLLTWPNLRGLTSRVIYRDAGRNKKNEKKRGGLNDLTLSRKL